jgi:hypothetical protein
MNIVLWSRLLTASICNRGKVQLICVIFTLMFSTIYYVIRWFPFLYPRLTWYNGFTFFVLGLRVTRFNYAQTILCPVRFLGHFMEINISTRFAVSISLSLCLSACLSLSVYLSICLYVCLSVCLSIYPHTDMAEFSWIILSVFESGLVTSTPLARHETCYQGIS